VINEEVDEVVLWSGTISKSKIPGWIYLKPFLFIVALGSLSFLWFQHILQNGGTSFPLTIFAMVVIFILISQLLILKKRLKSEVKFKWGYDYHRITNLGVEVYNHDRFADYKLNLSDLDVFSIVSSDNSTKLFLRLTGNDWFPITTDDVEAAADALRTLPINEIPPNKHMTL